MMQADSKPIQVKNSSTELDIYLLQQDAQALIDDLFLVKVRKRLEQSRRMGNFFLVQRQNRRNGGIAIG